MVNHLVFFIHGLVRETTVHIYLNFCKAATSGKSFQSGMRMNAFRDNMPGNQDLLLT